jgi:hypothetical protein
VYIAQEAMSHSLKAVFTVNIIDTNLPSILQFTMHPISSAQKENILSLASNGLSTRKIACRIGLGKFTVAQVLQDILSNHPIPSSGCSSKLSPYAQCSIFIQITTGKAVNAVQAMKHINTIIPNPVSSQTARNILKRHSFKAVTKKKKPLLTAVHRKKQLAFALKHKEWTLEDWQKVIWSDETKINRLGSDGKQWIWKQAGQGLIDREVQGTVKFGGENIIIQGCMGWDGVGRLEEVEGRMNADQYVEILEQNL